MTEIILDRPLCILIVDDDQLLNELLCEFLRSKDLQARSAFSLAEATCELSVQHEIDLVLLDYELGDGTGLDLMRTLTLQDTYIVPPVIMISVNEDPEFLQNCFSCGVADYIIKPINLSLLALKVRALIKSVAMQKLISFQNSELAHFKQEAEREEAVAKFIYEYLLGQNSQVVDGVNTWLKSSSSFSGDIAMARTSPSGDLYFMLADATGHGLSAAITIMPAVSIFNSMVAKGFHIQTIVTELNKKLGRDTPADRFVAAIIVQVQKERSELHVWNGGMPTACWVNGGVIQQEFRSRHMALGILDDDQFDANVETYRFPGAGFLFACTDGLLEERDPQDECFSMWRVVEIIKSDPIDLHSRLITALHAHTGRETYNDDVSMCTLTPSKMLSGSLRSLGNGVVLGRFEPNIGHFSWGVELSGRKIAECELPPLANKFLQYLGIDQSMCQTIFLIVSEMVSNAIDHGILRLDSEVKERPDGFEFYFKERERRLKLLTEQDVVTLSLAWVPDKNSSGLVVTVRDTGLGYDPATVRNNSDDQLSGRGLYLIRNLARSVEVVPPGNLIRAVISSF